MCCPQANLPPRRHGRCGRRDCRAACHGPHHSTNSPRRWTSRREGYAPPVRHARKAGRLQPALATSANLGKLPKFKRQKAKKAAPLKVGKAGKATATGVFPLGAFSVTWAYDLYFNTTDLIVLNGIVRSRLMIAGGKRY